MRPAARLDHAAQMDKRIVPISSGYVQIEYSGSGWGDVYVFDADGWEVDAAVWGMRGCPVTASEVLAERTSLSDAEAHRIASETNDQFKQRGGDPRAGTPRLAKEFWWFVAALGGIVVVVFSLGAVAGWLLL